MENYEKLKTCIERSGLLKYFVATERFGVTPKTLTGWLKGAIPKKTKYRKEIEKFTRCYCSGNKDLIIKIEDWE